jgi:hypothetical protein
VIVPLRDSTRKLAEDIARWTEELDSRRARGTLLQGIAGKAANGFEAVLRESLAHYLERCGVSYTAELAADFNQKPLDKLTLGEVVQSFAKLDKRLTHCLRAKRDPRTPLMHQKRLIGKAHGRRLADITKLRNVLHHQMDTFARDEAALIANTSHLLRLIRQELSEPLIRGVLSDIP